MVILSCFQRTNRQQPQCIQNFLTCSEQTVSPLTNEHCRAGEACGWRSYGFIFFQQFSLF